MLSDHSFAPLPTAAHRARVLMAVTQTPAPAREKVWLRMVLSWTAGLGLALAVFLFWAGGPELGERRPALLWATSFGALVAALTARRALIARQSMVGPPRQVLLARALALPPLLLAWKLGWSALHGDPFASPPITHELACFASGLALSVGPFAAALFARRGSDPSHPRVTGLGLGLASGAWGWFFLDLACPSGEALHLVAGHLAPMLVLGLAGLALGPACIGLGFFRVAR